jgi:aspartate ammonia-lyase
VSAAAKRAQNAREAQRLVSAAREHVIRAAIAAQYVVDHVEGGNGDSVDEAGEGLSSAVRALEQLHSLDLQLRRMASEEE